MRASLGSLPPELLPLLLRHLASYSPYGPPNVLSLLLLNKKFYYSLSIAHNPQAWAELFQSRFDSGAVIRRMGDWRGEPSENVWYNDSVDEEERLRREMIRQQFCKALEGERDYLGSPMKVDVPLPSIEPLMDSKGKGKQKVSQLPSPISIDIPFQSPVITAKHVAQEFKARCLTLKRIRKRVQRNVLLLHPSGQDVDGEEELLNIRNELGGQGELAEWGITDRDKQFQIDSLWKVAKQELKEDLWRVFFMLMEHDEKNLSHAIIYADLSQFFSLFFRQDLLIAALQPGYPQDTTERCLVVWSSWLIGDGSGSDTIEEEESAQESEEKFFVLKPYVFAAHKFDALHAPWTIKYLPSVFQSNQTDLTSTPSLHFTPTNSARIEHVTYFGHLLPCTPPLISLAATYSFFERIERDPQLVHLTGLDPLSELTLHPRAGIPGQVSGMFEGARGSRTNPLGRPVGDFTSSSHDRDWARLISCLDPQRSEGLPDLFFKGTLEGTWEGRFSFFDFDSYRDMLGGKMISLYEGPFGCQPQVWKLEETIVKVEEDEVGGKGSPLNAGFDSEGKRRSSEENLVAGDKRRVLADLGFAIHHPKAKRLKSNFCSTSYREMEESDEHFSRHGSRERYEIHLNGTGHSAWGQFILRGRIRCWDGMISLTKEYTPDGRGRWLYRGYLGNENTIVGRWRDTFTPDDLYGYEGTFLMQRRQI